MYHIGSFHLLQLLLNEFILHEVERLVSEDSMHELMVNMVNSQATELSDSAFVESLGLDFLSNPNIFHGHYEVPGQSITAAAGNGRESPVPAAAAAAAAVVATLKTKGEDDPAHVSL